MASPCRESWRCPPNAPITGTGGGGPGAALVPTQADSHISPAIVTASSRTRTCVDTFPLITSFHLMLAALVSRQKFLPRRRRSFYRLYALQPDTCQSLTHNLGIEILHFFPPIQFLNPRVINHHSKKAASRQQWIDFSEASGRNALPHKPRQHLKIIGNIVAKKPLGQLVLLQRAV